MTTNKLSEHIGKTCSYKTPNGLLVECVIEDTKQEWGRIRYAITPTRGQGTAWVEDVIIDTPEA